MKEKESDGSGEYVPVVYAKSFDEAEWYCQLLEDHDIPAIMDEDYEPPAAGRSARGRQGIPVLVPESLLAETRTCIDQLEDMEGFGEDDIHEEEAEDEFSPAEGFETKGHEEEKEEEEEEYF